MRRYSPVYDSPRRRYGDRERSPPRRGYGGGRRREQNHGSLLVRNIPLDCRSEELRVPFERFGLVRDVYIPKDYYTGEPRGFAFVQFVDPYDATEARYHMNGKIFAGREISVVIAAETRKRPEEMRQKSRVRVPSGYGGRRSAYHEHSRSPSISRSRSPRHPSNSRGRYHSRSYSPAPRRQGDYSVSASRRHVEHPRSPRGSSQDRYGDKNCRSYSPALQQQGDYSLSPGRRHVESQRSQRGSSCKQYGDKNHRSYSPAYPNAGDRYESNGYIEKSAFESEAGRGKRRMPHARASRSPSGSRSRSANP